ncbi:hypothetical protein NXS19_004747 [Fusarium pseudograminearum]|nr:hypothetical protein NXS19_004747 [Fusarium pseudograminearum]
MQFKTLFTASLLSGLTVAAPEPKTFGLTALRSGSAFHLSSVSASESGFSLLLPKGKQGAKCVDNKKEDFATFRISKDKKLVLYHKGKEQQIAYTDRSGMGQGVLQYTGQKNYPLATPRLRAGRSTRAATSSLAATTLASWPAPASSPLTPGASGSPPVTTTPVTAPRSATASAPASLRTRSLLAASTPSTATKR